jgi:hypothetical protein
MKDIISIVLRENCEDLSVKDYTTRFCTGVILVEKFQ